MSASSIHNHDGALAATATFPMGSKPRFRFGSFGLRDLWELIGNSSGMLLVAVLLVISQVWLQRAHSDAMALSKQMTEQLLVRFDQNSAAIDRLAVEVRKLGEQR